VVAALAEAVVGVVVSVWPGQDTFSPLFVERLETGFRL